MATRDSKPVAFHFSVIRKLTSFHGARSGFFCKACRHTSSLLLVVAMTTLASYSGAWSDEAFYQGKRITILIGT